MGWGTVYYRSSVRTAMAALSALLASSGCGKPASPCEVALANVLRIERDTASNTERPEFLARCSGLTPAYVECLGSAQTRHDLELCLQSSPTYRQVMTEIEAAEAEARREHGTPDDAIGRPP